MMTGLICPPSRRCLGSVTPARLALTQHSVLVLVTMTHLTSAVLALHILGVAWSNLLPGVACCLVNLLPVLTCCLV